MDIQIFRQNVTMTKQFKDKLIENLNKLEQISKKIMSAHVDLSYNEAHNWNERVRVEVNLRLPKKLIRAVERNVDLQNAFSEVEKKLKQQLRKYKAFNKIKRRKLVKIVPEDEIINE